MRYVLFLRGINVGGKKVSMEELRQLLESFGYKNVRTLLNSGNAVFDSRITDRSKLIQLIETELEKKFGSTIRIMIRSSDEIQTLIKANPFKDISVTPNTRLYITFLSDKPTHTLKIPYESPEKDFKILKVTHGEVISVLTLSPARRTPEAMSIIEKEFGKYVTTRNWNTVVKVGKLFSA